MSKRTYKDLAINQKNIQKMNSGLTFPLYFPLHNTQEDQCEMLAILYCTIQLFH